VTPRSFLFLEKKELGRPYSDRKKKSKNRKIEVWISHRQTDQIVTPFRSWKEKSKNRTPPVRPSLSVFYFYFQNWTFENKNKNIRPYPCFFCFQNCTSPTKDRNSFEIFKTGTQFWNSQNRPTRLGLAFGLNDQVNNHDHVDNKRTTETLMRQWQKKKNDDTAVSSHTSLALIDVKLVRFNWNDICHSSGFPMTMTTGTTNFEGQFDDCIVY
jgi:hypothetical protein